MAEEQRCQEGHRLCANNCGFFGSPATMDLCSKCYRDLRLKEERASTAKIAFEKSLLPSATATATSSSPSPSAAAAGPSVAPAERGQASPPQQQQAGRCAACRKRVGLVGFGCRCGASFCGAHRYPEQHGCTFDFKGAGREAIARANPVVKADKLGGRI